MSDKFAEEKQERFFLKKEAKTFARLILAGRA